jgi:ABC-type branched-subunit amino acid transport system ATPase component
VKKLNVKLNQNYKSFPLDFETELEGDLIILSGVNGSGKTQLIEVIRGYHSKDQSQKINRNIFLDGEALNLEDVVYKSFRDYSSIGNFTEATVVNSVQAKNTIYGWYQSNRLDYEAGHFNGHRQTAREVKKILLEKYGQEKFNSHALTQVEINSVLPRNFVLFQDDIFSNKIGEIFFNYVSLVHNKHAEASKAGMAFDGSGVPESPWSRLNGLFTELQFSYRFKSHYERIDDVINEQPAIYGLANDGTVDESQKRSLEDLSDGEKAIISLTFAMLASEQTNPKVFLLDEYEATLNPSLIEAFFVVLKRFFIEKGIQVVLVTHSSATISLAPEETSFYEVFKPKENRPRILSVRRGSYDELQKVYKEYYNKIQNEDSRIKEIQAQNRILGLQNGSLQRKIDNLTKPFIITEGKTDVAHLEIAQQKLGLNELDFDIFDQSALSEGLGSAALYKKLLELASVPHAQKIIGIFDRDEVKYLDDVGDFKDFGNNIYGFCIPIPDTRIKYRNISIEYYYSDDEIRTLKDSRRLYFSNEVGSTGGRGGTRPARYPRAPIHEQEFEKTIEDKNCDEIIENGIGVAHSKSVFANLVLNDHEFASNFNFQNFKLIFNKIKEIVSL